jgi:3-deoxy-manno-octulosonate cytidylyltransferase (CMP-KDO synthetase)
MSVQSLAVIPVRMAATRLPGKPLIPIDGRPVVQWVWDATIASGVFSDVVVATPDEEIADAVRAFDGEVVMTGTHHLSGTDRVAEVAASSGHDVIANIQGDQPFVTPRMLRALIGAFDARPMPVMTTVATRLTSASQHADPNTVKVILDRNHDAVYFSRAPIPHGSSAEAVTVAFHHLGLYAFTREFLAEFAQLTAGPLETLERLEQLRALENGHRIRVAEVDAATIEVNTEADLVAARGYAASGGTT